MASVYAASLKEFDNYMCLRIRTCRETIEGLTNKDTQYAKEVIEFMKVLNEMYDVIERAPREIE